MLTVEVEYQANLDRIVTAFPGYRLLNLKQMMNYLGVTRKTLSSLGIESSLTRESFRRRLSSMGREKRTRT